MGSLDTVRDKIRKLRRSADEKLLIKHGVTNEDGSLRKEGRFLVAEKVFEGVSDVKKAIVDDLKEIETAAEKAAKK